MAILDYPLRGSPSVGYETAYGGIPRAPDPFGSQGASLAGNLANLSSIYDLVRGTAGANAAGARVPFETNLPYYGSMITQGSQNILSNLRGEVPQDVRNLLATQAAERGIGFSPTDPNTNAAYLRALGITSLGRQDVGQQQLTAAVGRTPTGPAVDSTRFLVMPEQEQQWAWLANVLGAAPYPGAAARAEEAAALRGVQSGAAAAGGGGGGYNTSTGWYNPSQWWAGRMNEPGAPGYVPPTWQNGRLTW